MGHFFATILKVVRKNMNFRDEKIHTVSGGLSVLFLVLFILILSSAAAAQEVKLLEQSASLSEINPQNKQSEQHLINNLLDASTQIKFRLIYKEALQGISDVINYGQQHFKLSGLGTEISKKLTNPRTIAMILSGLVLFVCLIWLLIRHKKDITEIKTCNFTVGNTAFTEQQHAKNTIEALTDKYGSNPDNKSFDEEPLSLVQETKAISDSSHNNELISPVKNKPKRKGKNILEAAFENEISSNNIGFIQEQEQEQLIESNAPTETDLLNSVDEIRFVNEKTRHSKIDAFLNLTREEQLTEEMLSQDFAKIMSNKKVDVFIQEFEDVMSSMTHHTPAVNNTTNELENLLQFKLSIHFIKVLSEMMQATYLKQFSTTVIDFLDDVVNGNTRMTTDVTHRLVFVVDFYDRYIHSIKKNHS